MCFALAFSKSDYRCDLAKSDLVATQNGFSFVIELNKSNPGVSSSAVSGYCNFLYPCVFYLFMTLTEMFKNYCTVNIFPIHMHAGSWFHVL